MPSAAPIKIAAALVAGGLGATLLAAVPASASSRLTCSARMSTSSPHQYSWVNVAVHTASRAAVTTAAHYKTTTTVHHGTANTSGNATISYYISGATKGRKVPVTVAVKKGAKTGSCSTAFTPR